MIKNGKSICAKWAKNKFMDKINTQCAKIKSEKRMGLMTHVVLGYPDIRNTRTLANMMSREGADFIELQIPFSDPLGDGATIHEANAQALAKGVRPKDAFALVKILRETDRLTLPLFLMTYMNIPFTYGLEKFCRDAQKAGADGLIVPDYNPDMESADKFDALARRYGLALTRFISLQSSNARMGFVGRDAPGFIYCFSVQGITGARKTLDRDLARRLRLARKNFSAPLAVGFGISGASQVRRLQGAADIVVVGSTVINAFKMHGLPGARSKVRELLRACKK